MSFPNRYGGGGVGQRESSVEGKSSFRKKDMWKAQRAQNMARSWAWWFSGVYRGGWIARLSVRKIDWDSILKSQKKKFRFSLAGKTKIIQGLQTRGRWGWVAWGIKQVGVRTDWRLLFRGQMIRAWTREVAMGKYKRYLWGRSRRS